jgi:hypothetical protein
MKPGSLPELVRRLEEIEAEENSDVVVETKSLRMTPDGFVHVPALRGEFALTDWSRSQLASHLGIRWGRYSEDASESDLADEVTRRLGRSTDEMRVRSTHALDEDVVADGTIRALVSPGYSPVADSRVAKLFSELLAGEDVSVGRFDATPMTTSYLLQVGKPINPQTGSVVGDVRGSILVRNSGTGWASMLVSLAITRLVCLNGMVVQNGDSIRRAHRGLDDARLRSLLANAMSNFGPRVREAADNLQRSSERVLRDPVMHIVEKLITAAKLPRKLLPDIFAAYNAEPHPSAFGIAQALTLAAQRMTPELRIELETLAGEYLAEMN